jgi:site-specific recombinase XerC
MARGRREDTALSTLLGSLERHLIVERGRRFSRATQSSRMLRMLLTHMQGTDGPPLSRDVLESVKAADVQEFLASKATTGLHSTSLAGYRRDLRAAFEWLVDNGVVSANPVDETVARYDSTRRPAERLGGEEVQRLFAWVEKAAAEPWIAARDISILRLYFVHLLTPADVDAITADMVEKGRLAIPDGPVRNLRTVILDAETEESIRRYLTLVPVALQPRDTLFRRDSDQRPLLAQTHSYRLTARARAAGIRYSWRLLTNRTKSLRSGIADAPLATANGEGVPYRSANIDIDAVFAVFRSIHPRWHR